MPKRSAVRQFALDVPEPNKRQFDPYEPMISEVEGYLDDARSLSKVDSSRTTARIAPAVTAALIAMGQYVPEPERGEAYLTALRVLKEIV